MKKIFAIFAAALIAFSFASCEKPVEPTDSDTPGPLTFTFDFNVDSTHAFWSIKASDPTVWFYGSYNSVEYFNSTYSSIDEAPQQIMEGWKKNGTTYDDLLNTYLLLNKGAWGGGNIALRPNTEYIVYVFPIDKNLNVTGDIAYQTFKTHPSGYVDLGLPSGTLWAEESVQCLVSYDVAMNFYGNAIPSQTQWEELMNNCTWTYGELDDNIYGFTVKGSNGNTINLLCQGSVTCKGVYKASDTEGWYWTSTATDEDNAYAAFFTHYPTYNNITTDELPKCNGFSVHLVYMP